MKANILGLAELGELVVKMFNLVKMPNRILTAQFSISAPILPNRMLAVRCSFLSVD